MRLRLHATAAAAAVAAVLAVAGPAAAAVGAPDDPPTVAADPAGDAGTGLADEVIGVSSTDAAGIPTSRYEVMYDPGGWTDADRKVIGLATGLAYEWNKLLTRAATATIRWAYQLDVARAMADEVDAMAGRYDRSLRTGGIAVYDLVLFAAMVWCGWALLRGRTVQAAGELAVSWLVLVAFGVFVVAVPAGFARLVVGTVDVADGISAAVIAATVDEETLAGCPTPHATDVAALACPFQRALHAAFVERPYSLLNWGRDLAPADGRLAACAAARDEILADGPHGTSNEPRDRMRAAGTPCGPLAQFNADPTAERMMVAAAMGLVATLVLVLAVLIGGTLIGVQLLLVGLVAVLPFAVLAGVVPGSGRAVLWGWAAGVAKVVLVAVAMAMFLALYLMLVNGLLDATDQAPWMAQAFTLVAATVAMFVVRRRMLQASKGTAQRAGHRMAAARVGGAHGGGLMAAGGRHGPGYRGLDPRRYVPAQVRQTGHDLRRARSWAAHQLRRRSGPASSGAAAATTRRMSGGPGGR